MLLPGGDEFRLKVTANDGARTAADESDGTFAVPNHEPVVLIVQSSVERQTRVGSPLLLTAQAHDVDEPQIASRLRWSSDVDGELGEGANLVASNLSIGRHTISATVTDLGGLFATDEVEAEVLPAVPSAEECTEWLVDGNFESGDWGAWQVSGIPGHGLEWPAGRAVSG